MQDKAIKILILFTILSIFGCASLSVKSMIPDLPENKKNYNFGISVALVEGGAEKYPKRYSNTMNDDMKGVVLQDAIVQALKKSKMFPSVTTDEKERYILYANIAFQDTDFNRVGGGSFTFSLIVKYLIEDKKMKKTIYDRQFTSACLKTFSDSFGGRGRFNMALECSVKSNLSKFITDFSNNV